MRVSDLEKKIEELEKLKVLCLEEVKDDESLDTKIYKKYLELENVSNVAKWINEQGYKIESEATGALIKYQSNDITERLKDKKADVREDLKIVVQKLFMKNKKQVRRYL